MRARKRAGRAAVAAVVAVALVASCGEDRDGSAARPAGATSTAAGPPEPGSSDGTSTTASGREPATTAPPAVDDAVALDALVPELSAFVERTWGLPFEAPVEVALLDDAAFRQRLREDADQDAEELERTERVLTAVGLLEGDVDLAGALEGLLGEAVAGFYDPRTKELVVRGVATTPSVRAVVVHELTHALQDQHFGIDRPALDEADDETGLAFAALVEGDAVRVEEAYRASLSAADRARARDEEARQVGGIGDDVPRVLLELVAFPYVAGPAFARAVFEAPDARALAASFADPPTTSEQILHPDAYLARQGAVAVPEPVAPAAVVDRGALGEFALALLLAEGADPATAARAAEGWGGDRYVAWADGERTCVRVAVATDSPDEAAELVAALASYADRRPGTTVEEGPGPVTFTTCG